MTLLQPLQNQLGTDITALLPSPNDVVGVLSFTPPDDAVWQRAVEHLHVRDNDGHRSDGLS